MSNKSRVDVLREVNEVLVAEGLSPWTDLKRIGKHRSGEFEITGVSHVIRDLKQYYVIIVFEVLRPDGSQGLYGVRVTPRIPVCIVPMIGDKLLFVKQHRLTTGRWTIELPRGWVSREESEAVIGGTPIALLRRELFPEGTLELASLELTELGSVWEDTGTRLDQLHLSLIVLPDHVVPPSRAGQIQTRIYDWTQVHDMVDRGIINDQTTLTALYKVERFIHSRSA